MISRYLTFPVTLAVGPEVVLPASRSAGSCLECLVESQSGLLEKERSEIYTGFMQPRPCKIKGPFNDYKKIILQFSRTTKV